MLATKQRMCLICHKLFVHLIITEIHFEDLAHFHITTGRYGTLQLIFLCYWNTSDIRFGQFEPWTKRQAMKVNWTINTMSVHAQCHFETECCYIPFRMLTKSVRIGKVFAHHDQIEENAQKNVLPVLSSLNFHGLVNGVYSFAFELLLM